MSSIAVVGAGVIGLSSAVSILEKDPTVKVTLIADKFSPYTTSDGAAGLIMPFVMGSTPVQLQRYLAHLHFLLGSFYMSSSWKGFIFLFFYKRLRVCSHTFLQNYFGYLFEEFLSLCVSFNRLVCTSSRISSSFWNRSAFLNKRQTVSRPLHEVFREVRWYLWQPATVYNRLGQKCLENVLRYAHAQKIHPVGKFLKSWDISN